MFCRIRCRRQPLFVGSSEDSLRFDWETQNILFLCFIKPDVEPPKRFPRLSCSGGVTGSCPSCPGIMGKEMSLPHHCSSGYCTFIENRGKWALAQPWSDPGRHTGLSLWQQPVLFPLPAHISSPALSLQVCGRAVLPFSFCSLACLLAFFQGI